MLTVEPGFRYDERPLAARLYWQAFGAKLGKVLGPDARATAFLETILNPEFALSARNSNGALVGLAGFKTEEGGLADGEFKHLVQGYGVFGAAWRAALLIPLERKVQPDVLQMDGICVDASARGQGAGTLLLDAITDLARTRGLREVQLDVIDTNPRARALYERCGFQHVRDEATGPLRHIFGFASAARMRRAV